ncbi:PIN domain-containing protein [Mesorhizobium qingshengii]|uniref:PIN domain-containing protein n=1 Tax=Mesorhizobium qingshengii TaxID=1165689 RepID=UPI001ABFC465|nr:PIN domain-containing protein [Mesorhizobium qingshengii]
MISRTSSVAVRSYGGVQILAGCDLGIPKPSQIVKARGSCNIAGDIQYACMRLLLDTASLVAAIRSDAGAARQLLAAALERRLTLIVSVTLMTEYQAVMTRPEHLEAWALSLPLRSRANPLEDQ